MGQKPTKSHHIFILLGCLQLFGVALILLLTLLGKNQQFVESGAGIITGITIFPVTTLVVTLTALFNAVALPTYIRKHKPHGRELTFNILSLAISGVVIVIVANVLYQQHLISQRVEQETSKELKQLAIDKTGSEITKDEAIQLLKSCQLTSFSYGNQADRTNGSWGELSSTGVVLTKSGSQPIRISFANRLAPELLPIAYEAKSNCGFFYIYDER